MNAKQNLYDLQMKRLEVFKAQNPESDELDVVFEIDGKLLYANKYTLCSISAPLKAMLSNRWYRTEEPVGISDYSFDDFKEFITFIYSGECKLSKDNIFAMVDIAEYYDV
uniref:BTB domain-containing protein n=1 Tax=Panagrolaimus sp. ES5 TaxID=591445 RepID=A0AC34G0M7_9BILA